MKDKKRAFAAMRAALDAAEAQADTASWETILDLRVTIRLAIDRFKRQADRDDRG
jgi:hypothetical protein